MSSGTDSYDRELHAQRDQLKGAVTALAYEKMQLRQKCERLEKEVEFLRESRHELISKMESLVTDALSTAVHMKMDMELNKRRLKVWDGELDEEDDS